MKCSKCGAEFANGTQFCPGCGTELNTQPQFVPAPPKVTCRECGEINDSRFEFCQNCGAALGDVDPTLMQSEPRKEKS